MRAAIYLRFLHSGFSSVCPQGCKSFLTLHDVATLPLCINHMLFCDGLRMGGGDFFAFSNCALLISVFGSKNPLYNTCD